MRYKKVKYFPIPDLPATMLNDVLKKLGTMDLIHYSTISESCKNNVKSMSTRIQVKLGIKLGMTIHSLVFRHSFPEADERDYTICIVPMSEAYQEFGFFNFKKMTMGFNETPVLMGLRGPKELVVYWEKEIDGFIFMLDYITELFPHMPICDLLADSFLKEDTKTVIEWVKKREKPEVERCTMWSRSTVEEVSNLLDNVTITKALRIGISLPDDFKCDLPQNLKVLDINANWVSRDQLSQMNHEKISLHETKLQNKDISDLVNKIMNGDLPAIRICSIFQKSLKIDQVVNGINYDKIPSQLRCYLKPTKYDNDWHNVYGIYDYERADGKVVSICSQFPNEMSPYMIIFVWSRTEPLELLER